MTRRVTFHPQAERELNEAAAYYEDASSGLGIAFLDEIARAIQRILDFPEAAPLVNELVRGHFVRRFPYSILYSVEGETVRILAIANQKRRPFYWRDRQ